MILVGGKDGPGIGASEGTQLGRWVVGVIVGLLVGAQTQETK